MALAVLVSALFSNNVVNALRKGIDTFGLCYFAFLLGKAHFGTDAGRSRFVNAFLALGLVVGLTCLAEYRTFGEWNLEKFGDAHRVTGPFRYWETLGMLVAIILYAVWFKWVTAEGRRAFWQKAATLGLGAILLWCIYRTQTRTIMLATAIGVSVLVYLSYGELMSRRLVRTAFAGALLAAAALFVTPELLQNTRFYQQTVNRTATKDNRMETYVAAVRMFAASPVFGIGLKNFQDDWGNYVSATEVVYSTIGATSLHSSYLVVAAECGLMGLVPMGFLIWSALRMCWDFRQRSTLFQDRAWAVAVMGMTCTFFLCGITFDPFFDPTIQNQLFYMILGCTVGRMAELERESLSPDVDALPDST
jgi:O-antigen ligase